MVVAEALSCQRRVVGFKAGGPESIAIKEFSTFVDYPNVDDLVESIKVMLNEDKKVEIDQNPYSKHRMVNDYLEVYQKIN